MSVILLSLALSLFGAFANAASASLSALSTLHRRSAPQIPVACYTPAEAGQPCGCPVDLAGDDGVLINFYPGYQCAYPGGACTWGDQDGVLQNAEQTNCPTSARCPSSGCSCPTDLNGDEGVLINAFTGYQCAYTGGACTWDFGGVLQNVQQTNCPTEAKCLVGN